jgi:hypothetical protein
MGTRINMPPPQARGAEGRRGGRVLRDAAANARAAPDRRAVVILPVEAMRVEPDEMRARAAEVGLVRRKGRADADLCGGDDQRLAAAAHRGDLQPLLVELRGERGGTVGEHRRERAGEVEAGRRAADAGVARLGAREIGEAAVAGRDVGGDQPAAGIVEPGGDRLGQVPEDHVVVEGELAHRRIDLHRQELPRGAFAHPGIEETAQRRRRFGGGRMPGDAGRCRAGPRAGQGDGNRVDEDVERRPPAEQTMRAVQRQPQRLEPRRGDVADRPAQVERLAVRGRSGHDDTTGPAGDAFPTFRRRLRRSRSDRHSHRPDCRARWRWARPSGSGR